jgi:hypothetical protein
MFANHSLQRKSGNVSVIVATRLVTMNVNSYSFRLLQWFIIDVDPALQYLHHVPHGANIQEQDQ